MVQAFHLREQAERCRRLARDSTDPELRDSLLRLADEYAGRADDVENASKGEHGTAWQAGPDDKDAD